MKKITCISLVVILVLGLCACAAKPAETKTEPAVGLPNPMKEISADEMSIGLNVPADASDVKYFVYTIGETEMYEVQFTTGGKEAYARAQATAELEPIDFSGLSYTFTESDAEVSGRPAKVCLADSCGYISFLDVVPGIAYNVCINAPTTADELIALAETCYFPMQGEVG